MKRNWDLHELIEHWTLLPKELESLQNKIGSSRLGFAVNLKFFQNEGKFPKNRVDTPKAVLVFIAQQVNVEPEEFQNYDGHDRLSRYHRQEIREFCGFRKSAVFVMYLQRITGELFLWLFHLFKQPLSD